MTASLPTRGFSDVDATGRAADHAEYLTRVAAIVADERRRWFERLRLASGEAVLDAGCGTGEATVMLAELVAPGGRAVGVDRSAELLACARRAACGVRSTAFLDGDVMALPCEDATFDAAYCERVFLHLDDPQAAMGELARVLRPGGRLLVVDMDHSTAAIDADDVELATMLTQHFASETANWRAGRHLRSQAVLAGFTNVAATVDARVITDREVVRAITMRPVEERLAGLVASGRITQARADDYLADQDVRAADGRFQVTTTRYVVSAERARTRPRPRR